MKILDETDTKETHPYISIWTLWLLLMTFTNITLRGFQPQCRIYFSSDLFVIVGLFVDLPELNSKLISLKIDFWEHDGSELFSTNFPIKSVLGKSFVIHRWLHFNFDSFEIPPISWRSSVIYFSRMKFLAQIKKCLQSKCWQYF